MSKSKQFSCYTFFLILIAAIPKFWPEIIQMLGRQYGKHFTIEEVNNIRTTEKMNWLKRNPAIAARQVDYLFTKFLGPNVAIHALCNSC